MGASLVITALRVTHVHLFSLLDKLNRKNILSQDKGMSIIILNITNYDTFAMITKEYIYALLKCITFMVEG